MESERQIKVVLNDGGGLALAVYADCYAHLYDRGKQLANDLLLLERGDKCDNWENNEWGTGVTYHDDNCLVYYGTPNEVIKQILEDYHRGKVYGANHIQLVQEIEKKGWRDYFVAPPLDK